MTGPRAARSGGAQHTRHHGVGSTVSVRPFAVALGRWSSDIRRPTNRTTLRDGSQVLIRPVERTDGPRLVEGFARLSLQSRRLRFLGAKAELTAADVAYFTDIDHHDHEALVAISPFDGRAVGTARYIRDAADPQGADLAITVVDEWHRRGVASALISALVTRAAQEGVRYFTAHVAQDNLAIVRLLQSADADIEVVDEGSGVLVYRVSNLGAGTAGCASFQRWVANRGTWGTDPHV